MKTRLPSRPSSKRLTAALILAALPLLPGPAPRAWAAPPEQGAPPATQPAKEARQVKIDMDQAVEVAAPAIKADLQPTSFSTPDKKPGWVVRIPGGRPIATPAYAKVDGRGMLFVGGGYGSHEFYAFDASTGQKVWQIQTGDDGPTAAVVEDGYTAFNTESCTVIVVEARTGKLVWQEWLGDPLMSQPAICKGKLFIAYPAGQRGGQGGPGIPGANQNDPLNAPDVPGNAAPNAPANAPANVSPATPPTTPPNTPPTPAPAPPPPPGENVIVLPKPAPHPAGTQPAPPAPAGQQPQQAQVQQPAGSHRLLCADLKTGKHLWEQTISGDVISAPIVEGDQVFFTCFDGTSFCLSAGDGKIQWSKANGGTSAPVVANGQVVMTENAKVAGETREGIRRLDAKGGGAVDRVVLAQGKADYLKPNAGGGVGIDAPATQALDASVGFAAAPASAGLFSANANTGVSSVVGAWAYQGSKAAYANNQLLNAQGRALNCLRADTGEVRWRGLATGKSVGEAAQIFVPPALGQKNLFLCSTQGHLLSIRQEDGGVNFAYAFKQPMAFQPALAEGNMYVGTANGLLVCLKTGDGDADGWTAWGGNAQHNKKE